MLEKETQPAVRTNKDYLITIWDSFISLADGSAHYAAGQELSA